MESRSQLGVTPIDITAWDDKGTVSPQWQQALETGQVLFCPSLPFAFNEQEKRFLDSSYSDARRKSIYIRTDRPGLFGTEVTGSERDALYGLLKRFQDQSMGLLTHLFPGYAGKMQTTGTSFRPRPTGEGAEALSWRKDDTRLHIDAFPSNPTRGLRILRVFSNVGHAARVWRVGEPFEAMARHFLPQIPRPRPRLAHLSHALGITKRVRSAYDHYMLYLHDLAKADLDYQSHCSQVTVPFPPGSAWICFSDQVMHAAMSGQFMMEQTVQVSLEALGYPEQSPVAVLERLTGRVLL
jgi:hypothetical protein